MKKDFSLYTVAAAANRLGKTENALKQAIKRLRVKGQPLEIGQFRFLLVGNNGYIAVDKDSNLSIIEE